MKTIALFVVGLLGLASVCRAGEIYGAISEGGKPVAAGVKIEIVAPTKTYTAETDKFGSYRIFVKDKGKCTLKVTYKGQAPSSEVFSFEKSTRYDWVLESQNGKLALKRK